jgi:7-carboxy-7-deazaguanine synthase
VTTRNFSPGTTSGLEGPPVRPGHGFVTEMFSGIQGEGPYVGVRQIFVRLGGCDLRCWWCDTPRSLVRRDPSKIETAAGSREFETVPNPLPLERAAQLLLRLRPDAHDSVTFTGGEPLLQPEAVAALSEATHAVGGRTWLETHGARTNELQEVIGLIDVVSMDIKVPSSSGENIPLEVHANFLSIARQADVYAKLVVTPETLDEEVVAAARMISSLDSHIPFILQPVTPFGRIKKSPSPDRMLNLQTKCLGIHRATRVIPQTHKFLGQL